MYPILARDLRVSLIIIHFTRDKRNAIAFYAGCKVAIVLSSMYVSSRARAIGDLLSNSKLNSAIRYRTMYVWLTDSSN
jgi:hypothetical protein